MAYEKVVQFGDTGVLIDILVTDYDEEIIDVSSATAKVVLFKKPSGRVASRTLDFLTDGIDGRLKYTTVANDLDECGVWMIQVSITMPSSSWRTEVGSFRVNPNIDV